MDQRIRIQRAIDYIETNLMNELSLKAIADEACFSPFHFHRLFSLCTGKGVMEYVRERRLQKAAGEVQSGDRDLLEIALDYGFESRDSFSRAFRKMYGISPGKCRRYRQFPMGGRSINLQSYDNRRIKMIYGLDMRITKMDLLKVAGVSIRTNTKTNFQDIPQFWEKLNKEKFFEKKCKTLPVLSRYRDVCLAICYDMDPDSEEFSYLVGSIVDPEKELPDDVTVKTIHAQKYAVFTSVPTDRQHYPAAIQLTTRYIFSDWLPQSEWEYDDSSFDFEWYDEKAMGDYVTCDICIPVKHRN